VRRGKGEPTYKESDWVVCGFRYGVQKWNILCPDRFDIVHKSSDEKSEKGQEKGEGEKKICKDEADKAEDNSIEKKRSFLDFSFHKRSLAFGRVVYIIRSIGYFVHDVIGGGDGPCEKKGE
jgi:hypothetical protein